MSTNKMRNSFLPKDKPKSWSIFIISLLISIFIAGPLMFLGIMIEFELLEVVGKIIFFLGVLIAFVMWIIFMRGLITGRHKNIKEREWNEQIW